MPEIIEPLRQRWIDFVDEHPHLESAINSLQAWLPSLNFITIHYAYFTFGCLISSLIFWGSSDPFHAVDYVDSLFMVTSAMTDTGLNVVNVSSLTTWQQVFLWLLFILGSNVWVSFWTVMVRKHAFEKRFEGIVEAERERRRRRATTSSSGVGKGLTLLNLFSFRKYRTEPPLDPGMPGLGTRQKSVRTDSDGDLALTELKTIDEQPSTAELRADSLPGRSSTVGSSSNVNTLTAPDDMPSPTSGERVTFADQLPRPSAAPTTSTCETMDRVAERNARRGSGTSSTESDESDDGYFLFHWKKILGQHHVTRNGQFYGLTSDERERLGGCEYRALKILSVVVPLNAFLWQFLGAVALGAWIAARVPSSEDRGGTGAWWTGIFLGGSAYNNAGMSLVDTSMVPFQGDYFVLVVVGALVVAGNTAYPILLRFVLWSWWRALRLATPSAAHAELKETLEFMLKYPRRVYTTLFPSRPTWWLLAVLLIITAIDWVAFEVMNIGNDAVEALPDGHRVMDGLFQAVSIRAAGFVVFPIPSLNIDVQLLYVVMMYISVYPVVITMRNSNVYEERSLGIYDDDQSLLDADSPPTPIVEPGHSAFAAAAAPTNSKEDPSPRQFLRRRATVATQAAAAKIGKTMRTAVQFHGVGAARPARGAESDPLAGGATADETSRINFIGQQIRGQLAHDLWWLVIAILAIMVIETDHFNADPVRFSVFNVLLEVVSAYSCVGLSVGLPAASYSFAGGWHRGSKVVLCAVMLRGRHRGLPVALDRAVRLPGEKLARQEEEDHQIRRSKTMSRMVSQGV